MRPLAATNAPFRSPAPDHPIVWFCGTIQSCAVSAIRPLPPRPAPTANPLCSTDRERDAAFALPQRGPGAIEIALTNGRIMRVEEGIDPVKLGRLVAALD